MQFKEWVESERGRAMAVSRAIDVPPSFVSKMVSGEKAVPAEHCKAIWSLSGGLVTCQEMRPDDWHKYWPELAQAKETIGQVATETVATDTEARHATRRSEPAQETQFPDLGKREQVGLVDIERRGGVAEVAGQGA